MKIGIDSSRAFIGNRTGIEEYSYQVIKHLIDKLGNHQVILYIRKNQKVEFELPENWRIKKINLAKCWTQIGLAWELFFNPVDVLFVPAHIVPCIHPQKTVVTIHGLEYEIMPEAYSFWAKVYMRCSIRLSCRWAKKIIAVSRNTKKDLIRLYQVPENKIEVIYEGTSLAIASVVPDGRQALHSNDKKSYLLFIGRLEKRKNIEGIISAFEILREKYKIPHKLVLAGKFGYGEGDIKKKINQSKYKDDIILPGFVREEDKGDLVKNADAFLFPTFYEGFGLPILEAQSLGIPVVASNISSLPEVGGESVAYCDPESAESMSESIYAILNDEKFRNDIISRGYENTKRFSWEKCSGEIAKLITN